MECTKNNSAVYRAHRWDPVRNCINMRSDLLDIPWIFRSYGQVVEAITITSPLNITELFHFNYIKIFTARILQIFELWKNSCYVLRNKNATWYDIFLKLVFCFHIENIPEHFFIHGM